MARHAVLIIILAGIAGADETGTPEQALYEAIVADAEVRPVSAPERWFEDTSARHEATLRTIGQYLTSYPGGARRDDVIELELRLRFELGALRSGDFSTMSRRLDALRARPPSRRLEAIVAYWQLVLAGVRAERPAPIDTAVSTLTDHQRAVLNEYVVRFPRSRYAPRLCQLLFTDAIENDDRAALARLTDLLEKNARRHPITIALAARRKLVERVGEPFRLTFTHEADSFDTWRWRGRPVLVVVWAAFHGPARDTAAALRTFQEQHPDTLVLGIAIDADPRQTARAATELELPWKQYNDGLGYGHAFLRTWGIRTIPFVIGIDRAGRLVGTADDPAGALRLATRCLAGARPADAPPTTRPS